MVCYTATILNSEFTGLKENIAFCLKKQIGYGGFLPLTKNEK